MKKFYFKISESTVGGSRHFYVSEWLGWIAGYSHTPSFSASTKDECERWIEDINDPDGAEGRRRERHHAYLQRLHPTSTPEPTSIEEWMRRRDTAAS